MGQWRTGQRGTGRRGAGPHLAQLRAQSRTLSARLARAMLAAEDLSTQVARAVAKQTAALRAANRQLARLTFTDDVTGLYNQRFLFPRLDAECARAAVAQRPLAVIMLDIDHFKAVNDTHDHLFGSRVLRRVGQVLAAAARPEDIVARYGGDEFVIVLPRLGLAEARALAERLRIALAGADVGDADDGWRATASFGVAALPGGTCRPAAALLRAADHALLGAKAAGRNRVAVASPALLDGGRGRLAHTRA